MGKARLYEPDLDKAEKPFYNLMMFPILLPKDCMSAMSMPSPARIFTAVFNDCKETMFLSRWVLTLSAYIRKITREKIGKTPKETVEKKY